MMGLSKASDTDWSDVSADDSSSLRCSDACMDKAVFFSATSESHCRAEVAVSQPPLREGELVLS